MRRWKEEWTGRGREGSRVVGGGWGTSGKTWSQLIAPSFHGNARPFPPTPSLLSLSLSLCLIHSLTSFTLQFLFRFFFSSPFFSVSVRLCNHVTASSPPSARSSPPFLFLLTPSSPPPGFPPSFPLSFPFLSFPFFPLPLIPS